MSARVSLALLAGLGLLLWGASSTETSAPPLPDDDDDDGDEVKRETPDLQDAAPELAELVDELLELLKADGFEPLLYEVWRSKDRGAYLKSIGNSQAGEDSRHTLTDEDGKRASEAADIVDGSTLHGHPVWWGASDESWGLTDEQVDERQAAADDFFEALQKHADELGLVTISWDPAHVELARGVA